MTLMTLNSVSRARIHNGFIHTCMNQQVIIAFHFVVLKVKYKGILFYEILMDCVARKRMQKTTSNYLKWFPRYCDLNFYMLSH